MKFTVNIDGSIYDRHGKRLKGRVSNAGYLQVGAKHHAVHRLVATKYVPNPHGKPYVNHKDGDRLNNHADNLEWCTQKENVVHARDVLGRQIGVRPCTPVKLTPEEVIEIYRKYNAGGYTHRSIGAEYGVTHTTVRSILLKKIWKEVLKDE